MLCSVTLYILYVAFGVFTSTVKLTVDQAMRRDRVVPDVIPIPPTQKLKVIYPNKRIVKLGHRLTPTLVKDQPLVKWDFENNTTYYTLCMVNPDAPSRVQHYLRNWQHWLVGNIPGDDINKGVSLADYIGSGPPMKMSFCRYVFLVYKQPKMLTFDEPHLTNRSVDHRGNFSVVKFAKKYKLNNPVAGNYYVAEYDDYVPILYEQLAAGYIDTLNKRVVDIMKNGFK